MVMFFNQIDSLIACDFTLGPNLHVSIFIIPPLSVTWLHYREVPKGLALKLAKGTKH